MNCSVCGAPFGGDDKFCKQCGASLPSQVNASTFASNSTAKPLGFSIGNKHFTVPSILILICSALAILGLCLNWVSSPLLASAQNLALSSFGINELIKTDYGVLDIFNLFAWVFSMNNSVGGDYGLTEILTGTFILYLGFVALWLTSLILIALGLLFSLRSKSRGPKLLFSGFAFSSLISVVWCAMIIIANFALTSMLGDAISDLGSIGSNGYNYYYLDESSIMSDYGPTSDATTLAAFSSSSSLSLEFCIPGLGPILAIVSSVVGCILLYTSGLLNEQRPFTAPNICQNADPLPRNSTPLGQQPLYNTNQTTQPVPVAPPTQTPYYAKSPSPQSQMPGTVAVQPPVHIQDPTDQSPSSPTEMQ